MIFSHKQIMDLSQDAKNEKIKIENPHFSTLLCKIEKEDWDEAIYIAENKSKFTMNYSQNGMLRNDEIKFNNQLQGCLAEIALEQYLSLIGFEVVRYDKIRTDNFKSPKGEFDLKIILNKDDLKNKIDILPEYLTKKMQEHDSNLNKIELLIESRSSKLFDFTKIQDQPIIGKYSNQIKENEKDSDLFFKSLFYIRDKNKSLMENLKIKNSFIITGGCFLQDFKNYGYIGNLGQSNTKYHLLKIREENQLINFEKTLKSIIQKDELNFKNQNKKISLK